MKNTVWGFFMLCSLSSQVACEATETTGEALKQNPGGELTRREYECRDAHTYKWDLSNPNNGVYADVGKAEDLLFRVTYGLSNDPTPKKIATMVTVRNTGEPHFNERGEPVDVAPPIIGEVEMTYVENPEIGDGRIVYAFDRPRVFQFEHGDKQFRSNLTKIAFPTSGLENLDSPRNVIIYNNKDEAIIETYEYCFIRTYRQQR